MREERMKHRMKDIPGDFLATLDRVRPVHEHFGLHDRYEFLLLTQSGIPAQRLCIRAHASKAWQTLGDMNHGRHFVKRAPLRPSSPSVIVSSGNPAKGFAPVSTLMPGTMRWAVRASTRGQAAGTLLTNGLVI
jgi:hypothetical protein